MSDRDYHKSVAESLRKQAAALREQADAIDDTAGLHEEAAEIAKKHPVRKVP